MKKDHNETINAKQILHALSAITAAITNIKLYPSGSGIIIQTIEKAYTSVRDITRKTQSLEFSESENSLIVNGHPLGGKIQKMAFVRSFVGLMHELRIRVVAFDHDMEPADFESMLLLFGREAEEIEGEGGIGTLLKNDGISNISVETKAYTTHGGSEADKGNTRLLPFAGGEEPSLTDLKSVAASAENFRWVQDLFSDVAAEFQDELIPPSNGDMAEKITRMIAVLFQSAPYGDSDAIFSNIADMLLHMENRHLIDVLNRNRETGLLDRLINYFDEDGFVNLVAWLHVTTEKKMNGVRVLNGDETSAYKANYEYFSNFDRTRALGEKIDERIKKESRWHELRAQKWRDGIQDIINGNTDHLSDKLIMGAVPGIVKRMFDKGRQKEANALLDKLAEGLSSLESSARDGVSRALYQVGRDLTDADREKAFGRLAGKLNLWLKFEADVFPAYRPVCGLLRDHVKHLIQEYRLAEANAILETFNIHYYGRTEKSDEIRKISGDMLKSIGIPSLLKHVLNEFRANEHREGKEAYFTLGRLGRPSVSPLLDLLKQSDSMAERVRILGVLSDIGPPALPLLVERINSGESWYYLRNLLKLLGELGSKEHIDVLLPLLNHANRQVPPAALDCAFDIGGPGRMRFFIQALPEADEELKIKVVDLMGKLGEEEGVYHLAEILKDRGYDKVHVKNELDEAVCEALGKIGSKKAVPVLKAIVKQKGILGIGSYSAELCRVAARALDDIEKKQGHADSGGDGPMIVPVSAGTEGEEEPLGEASRQEVLLNRYLSQENKAEAVKLLYDMIVISARAKNFTRAEALREKLFEVDSMALKEIIRSGEVIEEEKNQSIANEYMEIWARLHERLTDEEASAVYYSLKTELYDVDSVITRQGERNSRLFFIHRGQVKIVYRSDGREHFLKVLGAGEIAGDDSFFPITVCTTSAVALSRVSVGCLERDGLKALKVKFPALESKLTDYCAASVGINELVAGKGLERRNHERVTAPGKVSAQLLDRAGMAMGKPFKGTLRDISVGGVAFKIRTSKGELARLLLGRKVSVGLEITAGESPVELLKRGTILSARQLEDAFFSFHLGFDEPVQGSFIDSLRGNTQ